jgi:hypothetical protein
VASKKSRPKSGLRDSNEPQTLTDHIWYYEEGRHLSFVVQTAYLEKHDGPNQTIQFKVPLNKLEKSLLRMSKSKVKKMLEESNHAAWEADKNWSVNVGD